MSHTVARFRNVIRLALTVLVVSTAAAAKLEASAIFTSDASASLVLTGSPSSSLLIFVSAEITEDLVLPFGSASGDTDGSADTVGTSLVQSAHAEGQATGVGFVDVFFLTDGSMLLENTGPSDLELFFRLDYGLSATASVDNLLFEDALGYAAVELLGTGAFAESGDVETSLFFFDVLADSLFGPPADDDGGSVDFSLMLPAASSGELVLFVDAEGFADSFVPEPTTSSLLALAMVTLAVFRRRR